MNEAQPTPAAITVRVITAPEARPLRHAVLRPGRPLSAGNFSGDDDPTTRHFGAYRDGVLLGVASVYRAELPEKPGVPAVQLRGMAVEPDVRGSGIGRQLIHACVEFSRDNGVGLLWCNARVTAVGFYRKLGFEIIGEEFEIPDVGPHFRMALRMAQA